jgi:hypothetical protein
MTTDRARLRDIAEHSTLLLGGIVRRKPRESTPKLPQEANFSPPAVFPREFCFSRPFRLSVILHKLGVI